MSERTGISWADHTFNGWWGCTEVSPACDNCYAREFAARFGLGWGHGADRRTFGEKHWNEPLAWNRKAKKDGVMRRVFAFSMADVFDEEAPAGELDKLWPLIDATDNLIWLLLTKRPYGYRSKLPERFLNHPRVWKGITAEDQVHYDLRWPKIKDMPGIRWISYEPALGPLRALHNPVPDWIVMGGESGSKRRDMPTEWADSLRATCTDLGIAFFMKQMSAATPTIGKRLIPVDLLIHQFPNGRLK